MKIAMVCPRTPRLHASGIEEVTMELSKRLFAQGFEVEIYTTAQKPVKNISLQGIPVYEFKAFAPHQNYFLSMELFKALKKSDADIIHCNGYNNLVTLAVILAKKKNQKLVLMLNSSGASSLFRKIARIPFNWMMSALAYKIDCVITTSNNEHKLFTKLFTLAPERFVQIPPGIDLKFIQKIQGQKKPGEIICIARLVKNKGIQHLLKGFSIALKKNDQLHLTLIGTGAYGRELKKLVRDLNIENKTTFYGGIPFHQRKELIQKIKESQMLALLSAYEGNPITVQLALACKTPVLVNNQGVLAEYVNQGEAVGVTAENHLEVAAKILEIIRAPEKFVLKQPKIRDWDEITEKLIQTYKNIIEFNLQ